MKVGYINFDQTNRYDLNRSKTLLVYIELIYSHFYWHKLFQPTEIKISKIEKAETSQILYQFLTFNERIIHNNGSLL